MKFNSCEEWLRHHKQHVLTEERVVAFLLLVLVEETGSSLTYLASPHSYVSFLFIHFVLKILF